MAKKKIEGPTTSTAPTRCWSYRRFSSPEQRSGDSTRRQRDAAARYAEKHGLVLDEKLTFADLGKSGYTGANVAEGGQLRAFLDAITKGLVPPGSLLLVEHLDRLSRQGFWDALPTIQAILNAGISIVTLSNEQKYDLAAVRDDPMAVMSMFFTLSNAKAESQLKSQRIGAAWKAKRVLARADKTPLTARCPGWLVLDRKAGKYRILADRARVVKRIFALTLEGKGRHAITELLNREHVPVFGRGKRWDKPYLSKILASHAVLGTFTPHTISRSGGQRIRMPEAPIAGFYPAVVDKKVFARVQVLLKAHAPLRGRHQEVRNIFSTLARCPKCHGTMTRVYKGRGPKGGTYLACATAKVGGGCSYHTVRYQVVEDAFLNAAGRMLSHVPAGGNVALDAAIENAETALDALQDHRRNLERSARGTFSREVSNSLRVVDQHIDTMKEQIEALETQAEELSGPIVAHKVRDLQAALKEKPLNRAKVNAALRVVFDGIVVDYTGVQEQLLCRWRHAPEEEASILYGWKREAGINLKRNKRQRG